MSLAILKSRALAGMSAAEVVVEVHLSGGLPNFSIVGLADTEVKESRGRVRAAILNARFEFPARTQRFSPRSSLTKIGFGDFSTRILHTSLPSS